MLFKKVENKAGMVMSLSKIDMMGKDILNILGPPHITDSDSTKSKKLGFPTKVSWVYLIFGIVFQIEYDASYQAYIDYNKNLDKTKSAKLKPTEKISRGEVIGDRDMVGNFIIPYLYVLNGDSVDKEKLYKMIGVIFNS